jgi:hypothetical protein
MEMETLYDYLRLCDQPHKRRYVAMSVMFSCSIKYLSFVALCVLMPT